MNKDRKFIYKTLVELGFKRFNMGDGYDLMGYQDFYLHLKVAKEFEFEWHPETKNEVRLVRYDKKGIDVQNVIIIEDMHSLEMMIKFFTKEEGNRGDKPRLSKKEVSNNLLNAWAQAC